MFDNFTITEMLWTALGVAGFIVTMFNWHDAKLDREALTSRGQNGDMQLIARTAVWSEQLRLIKMATIAGIGLASGFSPPVNPEQPISHVQIIVTIGLFIITGIILFQSVLGRWVRHSLSNGLREEV